MPNPIQLPALLLTLLLACNAPVTPPPPAPEDPLAGVDGLVVECRSDTVVFRVVDPIRLKGVVINHSAQKEIPFVMLPEGDLYNLIFRLQNLKDQSEFLFSDFHLMERGGLLKGGNTNIRLAPGDTLEAFSIDLQRMQRFTKSWVNTAGEPQSATLELEPGGVYAFSWTVAGSAHLTSRPFLFRIRQ